MKSTPLRTDGRPSTAPEKISGSYLKPVRLFHLASENRHLVWDNALDAAISVVPGDEIVLDLVDASGGQIGPSDDASAIDRLDFAAVNPCTGPVFVEGVPAGSEVIVSILEIDTDGWAWTGPSRVSVC